MFLNDDNTRHGNHACVNPNNPAQINGAFSTYSIADNFTNKNGRVENSLKDSDIIGRDVCNENQK